MALLPHFERNALKILILNPFSANPISRLMKESLSLLRNYNKARLSLVSVGPSRLSRNGADVLTGERSAFATTGGMALHDFWQKRWPTIRHEGTLVTAADGKKPSGTRRREQAPSAISFVVV